MSLVLGNATSAATNSAYEYFRDRWGRYPDWAESAAIANAVNSQSFNSVVDQINAGAFGGAGGGFPQTLNPGFAQVPWNPQSGWLSTLGGILGKVGGAIGILTGPGGGPTGGLPPGFPPLPPIPGGGPTLGLPTTTTFPTMPTLPTTGMPPLPTNPTGPTQAGLGGVMVKAGKYVIPAIVAGVAGDWVYDVVKGWLFKKHKHRRMNVLNPRALARADRRVTGFGRWAKKELKRFGFHVALNKRSLKHHTPHYHRKKRA